jgi:hypothetical protein
VKSLLTVGAGVIRDEPFVVAVGVGVSNEKPHSVENVTSWSQSVIVTLEASPVNVVAQTVVSIGAYTVSQLPVPVTVDLRFAVIFANGAFEIGTNCIGGETHHVISGMYDVMTWLCAVISIGAASGEGKMML